MKGSIRPQRKIMKNISRIRFSGGLGVLTLAFQLLTPSAAPAAPDEEVATPPNMAEATPIKRQALDWAQPAAWVPDSSPATVKVTAVGEKQQALRIEAQFADPNELHWAFPMRDFDPPLDFSDFDGIAFEFTSNVAETKSTVGISLWEPDRVVYHAATLAVGDKRRVVFLFRDFAWAPWATKDPNRRLDLDKISRIQIGFYTGHPKMWLEAGSFELVKFAPAP
jgi:hypothetical protein